MLLDDFYRFQKTSMLSASAEAIAKNIENDDIQSLAARLSEQNDLCVLVINDRLETVISAEASPNCVLHRMSRLDLARSILAMGETEKTTFHVFAVRSFRVGPYDAAKFLGRVPPTDNGNGKSMIATRKMPLSSGETLYAFFSTLITPVNATVETLRAQLLFITGVLVVLSFFLSLLLSKRITQPIVETTSAARALSAGSFTPISTRISYREVAELNEQLTQTAADLRKVETMQRELIANISHDLRTPLTLIEGYAEAMRDLPGENSPENMQIIIEETKRLTTLVNAVLEYSSSKNGQNEPIRHTFDLTESILGILRRYQKLTQQDGYQVDFHYTEHVPVFADELKVGQVIYNLINNALTYTGPDKTVTVTQTLLKGRVRIEVHDSGEGIPPEELPHIWNRYYRGSKPHKRAAMGTGLGLSIVRGILDSHQLPYGVDSAEGAGTTFWFLLPVIAKECT